MPVMTPTTLRKRWAAWHVAMRDLRAELRTVRALRATGRLLDTEEADGRLDVAWSVHNVLRMECRRLRSTVAVKYSHISSAAAARAERRNGA